MNRNIILVCFLLLEVTTIKSHKVTLSVLLDAVQKCKEIKRSDTDILGLILRIERIQNELNTGCTIGCVFMKTNMMLSNYSINEGETREVLKLFELSLNYEQIDSIVNECASDLLSSRWNKKSMSANIMPDSERKFNNNSFYDSKPSQNSSNESKPTQYNYNESKPTQYKSNESKPTQNNSKESQPNPNSFNESKPSQKNSNENKPNPVSFIKRKRSQNNTNKSKFSRRNSNEGKFIQNKPRLYKRSEEEQIDECTEAANFFECFNNKRYTLGYL